MASDPEKKINQALKIVNTKAYILQKNKQKLA